MKAKGNSIFDSIPDPKRMNIYNYFEQSLQRFPMNTALVVDGQSFDYSRLSKEVNRIASALISDDSTFVGLLAHRSLTAYAGVLGILKSGSAYVPLNPKFPAARNLQIIHISELSTIIVGKECLKALLDVAGQLPPTSTLIFPDLDKGKIPNQLIEGFECVFCQDKGDEAIQGRNTVAESYAYMLFTSGSTGVPKGVPITHGNVGAYVDYLSERYQISETDRFSQSFDLTFDLSVHDLFLAWAGAAALYCIPENEVMIPAKFIQKHQLTMWFSVPSHAQFMNRFKLLKPGTFPSLRYSLFCGEPLPTSVAIKWQEAAPNSILENIYGPTEATIGITHYRLPKNPDTIKSYNGIVSIGKVFETQMGCILNESLTTVADGVEGEFCLGGSQLSTGYWKNEDKTQEQFINVSALEGERFYKTGDIVKMDEEGDIYFITRKDFQVKIRGYRVELEEINSMIQGFLGGGTVMSIPFPIKEGMAENIYTFLEKQYETRNDEIIRHLKSCLPEYMIPRELLFLETFPLNPNGKIDQKALRDFLEQMNRSED